MTAAERPFTIGVDLGGTKIKTAVVDSKGHVMSASKRPTNPQKGSNAVIHNLLMSVNECLHHHEGIEALGVGVAGQVDKQGVVQYSPNLKWRSVPLKTKLEKELELPVLVTNDVNAATIGEWRFGSGRNVDDLAVVFVGTGIGGGVIVGGKVLSGCSNTGGELGHITIVVGGRRCHCPNQGCLEAYAGGWAIAERAQEAVKANPKLGQRLTSLAKGIGNITAETVSQAFHSGDILACRIIEETGEYLAAGAVSIINSFNPCVLAFGGSVIEGIPELIEVVDGIVRQKGLEAAVEKLRIAKVALGSDAGVIGVAALATELQSEKQRLPE
ncbi:MAG: ROK family protein [Candidatus Bathyarchaeota archaeon]|nr:MAG: ROK family protein [Candidatus Bathyarchaeota archaeon]